jgi:cytochrome c peroxidase
MAVPKGAELTPERVSLGRQLFFDKRLSKDGAAACNTCHAPDPTGGPRSTDAGAVPLARDPLPLHNVGYLQALFWDGRAGDLEAAIREEWRAQLGVEPGAAAERTERIARVPGYGAQFERAFGAKKVSEEMIVAALAAYLRSLTCGDTPYDRFKAGDAAALTLQQQKGLELFEGKGGCSSCHAAPFFSDAYGENVRYHNVGIGLQGVPRERADQGRKAVTNDQADFAAFRTPTLRGLARSGPYFHDGSAPTIDAAVMRMAPAPEKPQAGKKPGGSALEPYELQAIIDLMPAFDCRSEMVRPPLPPDP